jgi:hypothetical protein
LKDVQMTVKEHLMAIGQHAKAILQETFGVHSSKPDTGSPYDVFLTPSAISINKARQTHLASLGLEIACKRVLEVGAGVGLHTPFF